MLDCYIKVNTATNDLDPTEMIGKDICIYIIFKIF